jgi:hypothetical protein
MKRNIFFILILLLISNKSFAEKVKNDNGFFLKSYATIEYSAPSIGGGGSNSRFRTNVFERQIKDFENIAIGANFRVHKLLGFNINWVQSEMNNHSVSGLSLSRRANFNIDHYNISALFFTPKVNDMLEFFAELGVSDMKSKLNYIDSSGNSFSGKSHVTAFIYGAGLQFSPFAKSKDAFRFSVQKYTPSSSLINGDYMTARVGYLKAF